MHIRLGLWPIFIDKYGSAASPARKPNPAKAVSSGYTGAGPIRARYSAGCANHFGHPSHSSKLQKYLRE